MKLISVSCCIVLIMVLVPVSSMAQMTCGNTIISVGDNMGKVYEKCGKPTMTSRDIDGNKRNKGPNTYYYDQGSGRYYKKLFVQGGRIERIEYLEKRK